MSIYKNTYVITPAVMEVIEQAAHYIKSINSAKVRLDATDTLLLKELEAKKFKRRYNLIQSYIAELQTIQKEIERYLKELKDLSITLDSLAVGYSKLNYPHTIYNYAYMYINNTPGLGKYATKYGFIDRSKINSY